MGPDGYDGLKMTDDKSLYNKVLYTTHYSPDDTSNAKVQDFIKSYKKANKNADPNTFTALGYDSVYMMKGSPKKSVVVLELKDGKPQYKTTIQPAK